MPRKTIKDLADKPKTQEGPIPAQLDLEKIKVEMDAQHMVKVLRRVKEIAPELWGIFRVKA